MIVLIKHDPRGHHPLTAFLGVAPESPLLS